MIEPRFTMGLTEDAKTIRQEVFVEEQGFVDEFETDEAHYWNLVIYYNGYPIATGRLKEIDPETYQAQRVAVRKQFRGKRIGEYTMKFLITKARTLGARKMIVSSQYDKMGFYTKLGFKAIDGEIYLDQDCPHIKMWKSIVTKKHR